MRLLLSTTAVAIALLFAVAACGGSQSTGTETTPPTGDDKTKPTNGEPATAEPAKDGLGMAPNATVLAEDGSHVELSSAWLNTNAVIIFLRGHW